jgi:hypothetical protein
MLNHHQTTTVLDDDLQALLQRTRPGVYVDDDGGKVPNRRLMYMSLTP